MSMPTQPTVKHYGGTTALVSVPGVAPPPHAVVMASGLQAIPRRVREAAKALPELAELRRLQLEIAEHERERDAASRAASQALSTRMRAQHEGVLTDGSGPRPGAPSDQAMPSRMASAAEAARMELDEHLSATSYAAAAARLEPLYLRQAVAEANAREALERLVKEEVEALRQGLGRRASELLARIAAAIPVPALDELLLTQAVEQDLRVDGPLVKERIIEVTRGLVAELLLGDPA